MFSNLIFLLLVKPHNVVFGSEQFYCDMAKPLKTFSQVMMEGCASRIASGRPLLSLMSSTVSQFPIYFVSPLSSSKKNCGY
jgi:hypothetical protein